MVSSLLLFNNSAIVDTPRYIGLGEQAPLSPEGYTSVSEVIPVNGQIVSFTVGSKGHTEPGQGPTVALAIRTVSQNDTEAPTLFPILGFVLSEFPTNTQTFTFTPPISVSAGDLVSISVTDQGTWISYRISGTAIFQAL